MTKDEIYCICMLSCIRSVFVSFVFDVKHTGQLVLWLVVLYK